MNKLVADLKPEAEVSAPHVLQAISAVMTDLAREGIGKDRKNEAQGYKFRGIDDVYNALAPILARNHLVITPRCLTRSKEMIPTKSGGSMFYVNVDMEFTLASAIDGSTTLAQMFGEAMDSGDKATNKAMSAAYKYMAMQEFCIPTEGDNDADANTHQLAGVMEQAINVLRGCSTSKPHFRDAWAANKLAWKNAMPLEAYVQVVAEMKRIAAGFPPDEPAPQPPQPPQPPQADAVLAIADDEIPF